MAEENPNMSLEDYAKMLIQQEIRRTAPEWAIVLGLWCPICGDDTIPNEEHKCEVSFEYLKGFEILEELGDD